MADTSPKRPVVKVFITGASGFVGRHLAETLRDAGHDVTAFDILNVAAEKLSGVTYVQGDILSKSLLLAHTEGMQCVIHTAALVPLTKSGKDFYRVNVIGTQNVIACGKQHDLKIVHVSSSAIYGLPESMPITHETPYHPVEIYGQSKLDAEKEVWKFMHQGGKAVCIRPRTAIGGENRLGIFQILFEWISEGKNIYVIGDGSQIFQFVHIADLVDAIIKAALSGRCGLYNIGTDRYGSLREDLGALVRHAGTATRIKGIPFGIAGPLLRLADRVGLSPLAPWHYMTYHKPFVFDIAKAVGELNWKPRYSNQEALVESYDWYLSHKNDPVERSLSMHRRPVKQGVLKLVKFFS